MISEEEQRLTEELRKFSREFLQTVLNLLEEKKEAIDTSVKKGVIPKSLMKVTLDPPTRERYRTTFSDMANAITRAGIAVYSKYGSYYRHVKKAFVEAKGLSLRITCSIDEGIQNEDYQNSRNEIIRLQQTLAQIVALIESYMPPNQ